LIKTAPTIVVSPGHRDPTGGNQKTKRTALGPIQNGVEIKAMQKQVGEEVLEVMSFAQAQNRLYPGALFLHQKPDGRIERYEVKTFDDKSKRAELAPSKLPSHMTTSKHTTSKYALV